MPTIAYAEYLDRVTAGWMGKSIGGLIGVPFENQKQFGSVTEAAIWPAAVGPNDDLDIQVVWLEAMQERGLFLTSADLAEFWQDRCAYNFCEYGFFLHNVQRGIAPPLSGTWNNAFFRESEGCPIRSEIWGFVCPGNPLLAAQYARRDGQLDHGGVSVEIEQFLSAAAAHAFVSADLDDVLAASLSVLPRGSPVCPVVEHIRHVCEQFPDPYDAWRLLIRRYGDRDASKAMTNLALLLMALFLGETDFKKTIILCVNSGWDVDCTAATAGALLGVMGGTRKLPPEWVERLDPALCCGIAVKHKHASLRDLATDTCALGIEMAAARNREIEILRAPPVVVRDPPAPGVSVAVEYPERPVLWDEEPTPVRLTIRNPAERILEGRLQVTAPEGIACDASVFPLRIPGGEATAIDLHVRRTRPGAWLPDKNLFEARVTSADGALIAARTFGLGGARQWLVYGPYWDMWDKTRHALCPYRNDEVVCNPGVVGEWSDFYNHYVRPDHAYVDEARLLGEDIPEELPFRLERGEDLITQEHTGGFKGQACYYFVRVLRSTELTGKVRLFVGRTGPYKLWLDGELVGESRRVGGWAPHEDEGLECTLTERPQRLVMKFVRWTDAMAWSALFIGPGDPEGKRGVSYILDCLEDLPARTFGGPGTARR